MMQSIIEQLVILILELKERRHIIKLIKMYFFAENLIKEFEAIAAKNISHEHGKLIETLAFVAGFKENGNYIGRHLIFP